MNRILIAVLLALASFPALAAPDTTTINGTPHNSQTLDATNAQAVTVYAPGGIPLSTTGASSVAPIGYVGGFNNVVTNTPTVTASSYTANYAIGGVQSIPLFRNVAQPSGLLAYISVASKSGLTSPVTVYGFYAARNTGATLFSTCTDHAAFALSSSDLPYLIPGFPISITPVANNSTTQTIGSYGFVPTPPMKNNDATPSLNAYFCAVASGGTPASTTDLMFTYSILDD